MPEVGFSYIDIVFDGPPSAEAGRFVETEDRNGNGVTFGEWLKRDDGYWALRIPTIEGTSVYANREIEIPIPLIVHCPKCYLQHVDVDDDSGEWATGRLHRRHLCKPEDGGCGNVWAPSTFYTVGVRELPVVEA